MNYWGMPVRVVETPTNPVDNNRSTEDTVQEMRLVARNAASSPQVVNAVAECLHSRKHETQRDLVRAVYYWVQSHLSFVEDESQLAGMGFKRLDKELLIHPAVLLSMPSPKGDCDDYTMLSVAMLLCAGVPVMIRTIACDENEPWRYSHVYCVVFVDGQWVPFDASHGKVVGWEYQGPVFRKVDWYV